MNKEQISEKDIKKVSGGANTKKSESDNSESSREEICRKCGKTFLVADALACSFTSGEKIWNAGKCPECIEKYPCPVAGRLPVRKKVIK